MTSTASNSLLIASPVELPQWARQAVNLADPRIGAAIHSCSDEFFAPAERMLQPAAAVFVPGKYDDNGKWMDGWESRRRRGGGHDWCVVTLARPAVLYGVDIDTSFFTGNYPSAASLEGCFAGSDPNIDTNWKPLLDQTTLTGNQHHLLTLPAAEENVFSHLRLNIFPDGGIARFRTYGRVSPPLLASIGDDIFDLAALVNGARPIAWNDAHFGSVSNMLQPGRGADMGDGWETRRRREPGHDWCIIALALPGRISHIEVDTAHFKGNYPDRVSLQASYLAQSDELAIDDSARWPTLLSEQPMRANSLHEFEVTSINGPVTHVRLNLFPDGGVSRLRLWGRPVQWP